MAWVYLLIASVFEILFAISMKYADGFHNLIASAIVMIAGIGGIIFLTLALKTLPVSIAYPIWTGIGIIGTVIFGALLLNEPITIIKIISIMAIVGGIIGLKMSHI